MTDVLIYLPFSQQASQGNSVTAGRMERMLRTAGFSVAMGSETYGGAKARCMVALNARRSAEAVVDFTEANPGGRVVVVLTGTDINHPEMADADSPTRRTMDRADALVALHEADLENVASSLRGKSCCIYPSVRIPGQISEQASAGHEPKSDGVFRVLVAGNLRPVKNPQLVVGAARLLPESAAIQIVSYGDAAEPLASEMRCASEEISSFDWLGQVDHPELIGQMKQAHLLLNTSTQEGGANAICEAVTLGLPVVASRIRGNIGMLGEGYAGFFPSDDAESLAEMLQRCASDPGFYGYLKEQVSERASLFTYAVESQSWADLIRAQLLP